MNAPTENEREEWTVPVLDAVRLKPATLIVAVAETRVVVVPPPAAASGHDVPHESIELYCDALRAADSVARRRLQGYRPEGQS